MRHVPGGSVWKPPLGASAVVLGLLLVGLLPGGLPVLGFHISGGTSSTPSSVLSGIQVDQALTVSPSATVNPVDVGQLTTISAGASGGSVPYTYSWSGSVPPGCMLPSGSSASFPCTPTSQTGPPSTITVQVTDAGGNMSSGSFMLMVDPALVVSPSATVNPVEVGQMTMISAGASGGSGGYTYSWSGSVPPGCTLPGGGSASFPCVPTSASGSPFTVKVAVTDSNGNTVSGSLLLTVNSVLSISPPTATPNPVDALEPTSISVSVGGGTGGNTFTWYGLPPGCSSSNSNPLSCTPSNTGNLPQSYFVYASVTDSNGDSNTSSSVTLTVNPPLTATVPVATPATVDIGQTVKFTTIPGNGTEGSGYSYTWSGLPKGCTSQDEFQDSCTPTGSGTSLVNVTVKDANGVKVTAGPLSFVTDTDPVATTPVSNLSYIYTYHNVTFSTIVDGVAGSYAPVTDVRWWGFSSIPGCGWISTPSVNAASVSCTPDHTTNGSVGVYVEVTDANGFNAYSENLTVIVLPQLSPPRPTATLGKADLGMSVTFSLNTTGMGGSPPYSYVWKFGNLSGCASVNEPTVTCTPTAVADYWVNVTVKTVDGPPYLVATSANFTGEIFAPLTLQGTGVPKGCDRDRPLTSCAAPEADVGQELNFTALASEQGGLLYTGGVPPYSYVWPSLSSDGCSPDIYSAQPTCGNLTPGVFTVSVTITDAAGASVTSSPLVVTIYPDPSVSVPSSTAFSVDVGQAVTFSANGTVSSGLPPYADYHWAGLPASCVNSNISSDECIPTRGGVFYVTVSITDSNGMGAKSPPVELTVYPDMTVALRSSAGRIAINHTVTFYATATQGSGGYSYTWSGLPGGCAGLNAATLPCTPTVLGSFHVTVSVQDSDGAVVNHSVSLAVLTVVPPAPFVVTLPLAIGAGVAAAVVGLLVFFVLRGTQLRRRVQQRSRSTPPTGAGGPGPSVRPVPRTSSPPGPQPPRDPAKQGPR
jgi:hypothetical protein